MHPGSSVSGLYFSHPIRNISVSGQIGRDQVLDTRHVATNQCQPLRNGSRLI
jgi:hypothetical protein